MPQGLSPIIHRCCAVPQQEHVGKSGSWGWSMLVAVTSPSALHAGMREPQAPVPNTSAGVNNTHHHGTWTKSGPSSGRIAHHTATCSWTVCWTERSLLKMKETLASIPPVKRINTAPFLSYQHFMIVTQGSSVHQAFRPARSRKIRTAAGRSVDDKSTLPRESAAAFAVTGL